MVYAALIRINCLCLACPVANVPAFKCLVMPIIEVPRSIFAVFNHRALCQGNIKVRVRCANTVN